ncbi:hypothetical protein [Amycolatopsis sp. NBC_00438]|uniref:hypothetical protein n=1 Tax=Amycolatopsis sp. NBC_00438 TaxID=2903558 RepID=UPI002E1C4723
MTARAAVVENPAAAVDRRQRACGRDRELVGARRGRESTTSQPITLEIVTDGVAADEAALEPGSRLTRLPGGGRPWPQFDERRVVGVRPHQKPASQNREPVAVRR